jgi:hypothetical protein
MGNPESFTIQMSYETYFKEFDWQLKMMAQLYFANIHSQRNQRIVI